MFDANVGTSKKVYKLVLLGDGGVGKTSIRKRYMGEGFTQNYMMTIGAEFSIKRFDNNKTVVQIWDLAGQPRFNAVRQSYYQGTSAAILVYDVSRPESFQSIPNWISEVLTIRKSTKPLPLVLVANKNDLRDELDTPMVEAAHGEQYSKDLSDWAKMEVPFIETSAKTGFNVDELFESIVDNINKAYVEE